MKIFLTVLAFLFIILAVGGLEKGEAWKPFNIVTLLVGLSVLIFFHVLPVFRDAKKADEDKKEREAMRLHVNSLP